MKILKRARKFLVVLIFLAGFFLINSSEIKAEKIFFIPTFKANWPHIDRNGLYDYAGTGFTENNRWYVWFCGEDRESGRLSGDSIFYWRLDEQNKTELKLVLPNSQDDIKEDGRHSCAPSVIKHSHPNIFDGREIYKIYYECARRFYDRNGNIIEGFTQICHAISFDGINWQKYNKELWDNSHTFGNLDTPPTPVIEINEKIKENCNYQFVNNKHLINNCIEDGANYGVGHPSAIVREINGGQQIWLYYYDSGGDWNSRKVYLRKSWDGFHFEPSIATNLTQNVDVKYFNTSVAGYPGFFIATQGINNDNYFAYSFDGIMWHWYENTDRKEELKIGKAIETHQIAYAQPNVLGNKFGMSDDYFVNILSGEGMPGNNWWENSGLWLIQGKFIGIKKMLLEYLESEDNFDLDNNGKLNSLDIVKLLTKK